ncbi:MAG: DNA translocase FtsK [Verrucomicrobium sp.]|nr:DNA translocase FtsK [Verrucomicrobium sp.]
MAATKPTPTHAYAEVWGILCFGGVLLTVLSLFSYDAYDIGVNTSQANLQINNAIGPVGAYLSFFLFASFGMAAYVVPLLLLTASIAFVRKWEIPWKECFFWAVLFLAGLCGLLDLPPSFADGWRRKIDVGSVGGFFGENLNAFLLVRFLGRTGAAILLSSMTITSFIFLFRQRPIGLAIAFAEWCVESWQEYLESRLEKKEGSAGRIAVAERRLRQEEQILQKKITRLAKAPQPAAAPAAAAIPEPRVIDTSYTPASVPEPEPAAVQAAPPAEEEVEEPAAEAAPAPKRAPKKAPAPAAVPAGPVPDFTGYALPPLDLLQKNNAVARPQATSEAELRENAELLVATLRTFGIEVTPGDITKGTTITRYEVYPAPGVRVDRIVSLQRDLARSLKAERINILAPIPGRDSVGIEIPNTSKVPVVLRDLFETPEWTAALAKGKIPLALGKDVYGQTLVADLAEMPHLLIAGTTGSGKSVCINSILLSLLFKFTPADLRLILVDPKQVEMQVYNAVPHLVVPVVVEPKKVLVALNWVIKEMEKRYRILAQTGVRNISAFNGRVRTPAKPASEEEQMDLLDQQGGEGEADDEGAPPAPKSPADDIPDRLPYIVVIIDELADLMQTTSAEVETAIVRLCQKARAAGIHLIVATQTPRREVITSLIKTNIPSRVAFQVPSALDSRVILDENGAENLLGKGDMLYLPPGSGKTLRGQGAFVSDEEVLRVVEAAAKQAPNTFDSEIHRKLNPGGGGGGEAVSDEDRELVLQCMEVMRQEKRASTSMLQRRLRLGYNRAAWVVDFLERNGVLGPENGAKPREILVDLDQFDPESLFAG